jgi:hypothetical protein
MRGWSPLLPSGRRLLALDVVLALWVAGWIWLGLAVGGQVSGLQRLSTTIGHVGSAVQQSGALLSSLKDLPFVGNQLGKAASQVEQAGRSATASAHASRDAASHLSWMLALAIAVIPSTPVLGLYLPIRAVAIRERRTVRRLWRVHGDDPDFRELLARRAIGSLPYSQLARAAGPDPWRALAAGHHDGLARAELERWGVRATRSPAAHRRDPAHQRSS